MLCEVKEASHPRPKLHDSICILQTVSNPIGTGSRLVFPESGWRRELRIIANKNRVSCWGDGNVLGLENGNESTILYIYPKTTELFLKKLICCSRKA